MAKFLLLTSFLLLLIFLTGCESTLSQAQRYADKADELCDVERYEEALEAIDKAIEIQGGVSGFHETRGYVLESVGNHNEAILEYRKALKFDPDNFWAKNNYVSILSLSPDARDRNGQEAVDLAKELIVVAMQSDDDMMKTYSHDTYGSALAEVGKFEEAVEACEKAFSTATDEEKVQIRVNLAAYREGRRTRYPQDGSYGVFPEDE